MPLLATLITASALHAWPLGLVQRVEVFRPTTADLRVSATTPLALVPEETSAWASAGVSLATELRSLVDRDAEGMWQLSFDGALFETGQTAWIGYVAARRPGDRTIGQDPLLSVRVPAGIRFDLPRTAFDPVLEVATTVRSIDAPFHSPRLYDSTFGVRWTP